MKAYKELEAIFARWTALNNAAAMLQWDNATMMPENAGDARGEQLATLAELSHETITHPHLGELFDRVQGETCSLSDWQQSNMREMQRLWKHETAVPAELVSVLTKACHESELFWRTARKEDDFRGFAPHLEKVLSLVRESAHAKSHALGLSPYDALLDQYDPGTRADAISPIFDDLAQFLPGFIAKVMDKQAAEPAPMEVGELIHTGAQKSLGMRFMKQLGFDFSRGRLDESTHPFCGGVPGDIRLTARYDEKDFLSGFFAVMHETGHALYEMGLPREWTSQPVGSARGMAFHESQSLLCEMQLCISPDFLHYAVPVMREAFATEGPAWTPENIYRLMTRVRPSLIRVDADEVTYPAHVILRYRLERQLIDGTLAVRDLPEAWREQMQLLLGIVPDSDANGCMQDIHWPDGTFGYFPTYTLGAMTATQLFQSARAAIGDPREQIRAGEFGPLWQWLRDKVHSQGSRLTSPDLLSYATGRPLDVSLYKQHLHSRYLGTP